MVLVIRLLLKANILKVIYLKIQVIRVSLIYRIKVKRAVAIKVDYSISWLIKDVANVSISAFIAIIPILNYKLIVKLLTFYAKLQPN